ncbi:MAG: PspA/IM30 family protein [Chloroflexota bacterium]|jgi:phage shock protein A|nr:PspA/IM30 family protein [Chloroflexota bacterium]
MGIMDRLSRLIRANLNHQLDRAENPEVMLEQILRDMHANLVTARARTTDMVAQEKELEADLEHARREAARWGGKAEAAVAAGKDDLARIALRRKRDNEENGRIYERQLEAQRLAVTRLKGQLQQLDSKYQTALSRKDVLIARQRLAKSTQAVASQLSPGNSAAEMDRAVRKIRATEARAAAASELAATSIDSRFMALEDPALEADLRALKARLAGAATDLAPADESEFDDFEEFGLLELDAGPDALKSGL